MGYSPTLLLLSLYSPATGQSPVFDLHLATEQQHATLSQTIVSCRSEKEGTGSRRRIESHIHQPHSPCYPSESPLGRVLSTHASCVFLFDPRAFLQDPPQHYLLDVEARQKGRRQTSTRTQSSSRRRTIATERCPIYIISSTVISV